MTTIRRGKLPEGVWAVAWRDAKGQLTIVFAEAASASEHKAAAARIRCLARSLGWGSGVVIPAAGAAQHAAHATARAAATAAGAAGISVALIAVPAVLHSPAHAAAPAGRAPAQVLVRAGTHARGRKRGKHAAPAVKVSPAAGAAGAAPGDAVPLPVPSPSVAVSAGVTTPQIQAGPVTVPSVRVPVSVSVPLPSLPALAPVQAGVCADVALLQDEPPLLKLCAGAGTR